VRNAQQFGRLIRVDEWQVALQRAFELWCRAHPKMHECDTIQDRFWEYVFDE